MPFKSKKQKRTIDAAAHNPAFAKKVGINVADAKRMSAHGKGQTKFEEERTEVKDKDGKVTSWQDETPWRKTQNKNGRGKVTNLSDKARRETEKLSKAEKDMAEAFVKALEGKDAMGRIEGGVWVSDPKGKVPAPTGDPEGVGASEKPAMRKMLKNLQDKPQPAPASKPVKKSDAGAADQDTAVASNGEEEMPNVAEAAYSAKAGRAGKDLGKKGKNFEKIAAKSGGGKKGKAIAGKVLKDIRAKHLKESILTLSVMIAEAKKKAMKCDECGYVMEKCACDHTNESYTINGKKVTKAAYEKEMKKAGKKVKEGNDGNLANNAKPYDKVTRGDVIAGRLGKDEMGGKKKDEKTTEGNDGNLANNAKPYDKVTRGDVIAGRLGKDEMGGKKKKVKESYSKEQLASRLFENEEDTKPDHEARMARAELLQIAKNAMQIFQIVKEGENLDGWISSYISISNDHLNSVAEALVYDETRDQMEVPSDDEYMEQLREALENFKQQ